MPVHDVADRIHDVADLWYLGNMRRILDIHMCKLGTLAHNRAFSARDVSEYVGVNGTRLIAKLRRQGMIKKVGRTQYYPTPAGWRSIEAACVVYR